MPAIKVILLGYAMIQLLIALEMFGTRKLHEDSDVRQVSDKFSAFMLIISFSFIAIAASI